MSNKIVSYHILSCYILLNVVVIIMRLMLLVGWWCNNRGIVTQGRNLISVV